MEGILRGFQQRRTYPTYQSQQSVKTPLLRTFWDLEATHQRWLINHTELPQPRLLRTTRRVCKVGHSERASWTLLRLPTPISLGGKILGFRLTPAISCAVIYRSLPISSSFRLTIGPSYIPSVRRDIALHCITILPIRSWVHLSSRVASLLQPTLDSNIFRGPTRICLLGP